MSLFSELKRRNVFRVAAAYIVGGWLLLQVADVLLGNFGAPDWVFKSFAALLVLGFPVAVFLAWAFELTPDGVKPSEAVPPDASITSHTGQRLNYLIIAGLVAALAYFIWERQQLTRQVERATTSAEVDRPTVAVLPFVNMSDDPEQDYFSDGMTEEAINRLVAQPALKVVSRTSVFSLRDSDRPLPEIAEELGATYIVEGSVRRADDTLRVTAQLIEAATDTHLWSDTYDRPFGEIFAIQDELAEAIASALGDKLGFTATTSARAERTEDLDAYEDFLVARARLRDRDVIAAERLFASVLERAPDFAEAQAFHAISLTYLYERVFTNRIRDPAPVTQDGASRFMARRAAREAFRLAPNAAMTQYALALLARIEEREFDELVHYRNALAVDPENPLVLEDYVQTLTRFAVWDGHQELSRRLLEADPLWHVGQVVAQYVTLLANEPPEQAIAVYRKLLEERTHLFIFGYLTQVLTMNERWDEAIDVQARALEVFPDRGADFLEIDLPALRDWRADMDRAPFRETPFAESLTSPDPNFFEGLFLWARTPERVFDIGTDAPRFSAWSLLVFAARYPQFESLWDHPRMEDYIRHLERRWDLPVTTVWREFGWP